VSFPHHRNARNGAKKQNGPLAFTATTPWVLPLLRHSERSSPKEAVWSTTTSDVDPPVDVEVEDGVRLPIPTSEKTDGVSGPYW
jgi:hypothetical protein